jgi:DNA polymerase III delta prime subunit
MNKLGPNVSREIDGSLATGIDFVRTDITRFGSSVAMFDGLKICFIDEADYISKKAQAALRKPIEKYSSNARFIFAVNDKSKLLPAITSRLMPICFDIDSSNRSEVIGRLRERCKSKLSELSVQYDEKRLNEIVGIYYPDFRAIANHLEFEFA